MYNFTQSSRVLECVGTYVDNYSSKPAIDIYISNIPDHTIPSIESGFLTKNAVMMVTTAIDRLNTNRVAVVGQDGGQSSRRQIQILGSFTELNRTTKSNALSSEAVFPGGFELEVGADKNFNHIALDLAMSESNRIVPGTATSVSIQLHGNSGDVTLTYDEGDDFAAIGALGFTAQEGFHAAQRLLIETAVALMVSKYFDVDMKNCLQKNRREKPVYNGNSFDKPVFVHPKRLRKTVTKKSNSRTAGGAGREKPSALVVSDEPYIRTYLQSSLLRVFRRPFPSRLRRLSGFMIVAVKQFRTEIVQCKGCNIIKVIINALMSLSSCRQRTEL